MVVQYKMINMVERNIFTSGKCRDNLTILIDFVQEMHLDNNKSEDSSGIIY